MSMQSIIDRPQRTLYHYTSLEALVSILGRERILLWATNASYLNDPTEISNGIEVINEIEKSDLKLEDFRNYYLTSFSDNPDSLVMWSKYGSKGGGCSIGFDYDCICRAYGQVCKCIYGKQKASEHLRNSLNLIDNGVITSFGMPKLSEEEEASSKRASREMILQATCLMVKNEAYSHENETRGFVCVPPESYKYVNFRLVNNYVSPYVQMELSKNALRRIVIGPTLNADITLNSIKKMLEIRGYELDGVEVINSKIPFRG